MITFSWLQRWKAFSLNRTNRLVRQLLVLFALLIGLGYLGMSSALAGISDDRFDGNIFVLYAGNGALVPPKVDLATSLQRHTPALLTFYLDDSRDCKEYAIVISNLQAFYGREVDFIPVNVDTIAPDQSYPATEAPYYYTGAVPQVVLIDQAGEMVFNETGQTPYEQIDDVMRGMFNLPARSKKVELERPEFSPSPSADTTFWTAPFREP